jgi:hypothetical protein
VRPYEESPVVSAGYEQLAPRGCPHRTGPLASLSNLPRLSGVLAAATAALPTAVSVRPEVALDDDLRGLSSWPTARSGITLGGGVSLDGAVSNLDGR